MVSCFFFFFLLKETLKTTATIVPVDLEEISDRMKVREAIQQGRISESIEIVNELDPEVFLLQQASSYDDLVVTSKQKTIRSWIQTLN